MAGVRRLSILVADDDPGVIADYRAILSAPKSALPPDFGDFAYIEDDLFRVALAHEHFPEVDLIMVGRPEEAIQAVRHGVDTGGRYTMAFIGVELRDGDRSLAAAESIRAIDPDMPIALVVVRYGMHPLDVYDRAPLASRTAILGKPIHAVEVEHLALSLPAGRRTEESTFAVAGATSSFGNATGLHENCPSIDRRSKAADGESGYPCLDSTTLTDSDPQDMRVVCSAQSVPWVPLREARGPTSHRTDLEETLSSSRSDGRAPSAHENGAD